MVLYKIICNVRSLKFSVEILDSCDCVFGVSIDTHPYGVSNTVSLVAVPIMHQEIISECRRV